MLCDCDEVNKVACLELKKHPDVHIVLYYIYLVCTFRNENTFIFHSQNYIFVYSLSGKLSIASGVVDNYTTWFGFEIVVYTSRCHY